MPYPFQSPFLLQNLSLCTFVLLVKLEAPTNNIGISRSEASFRYSDHPLSNHFLLPKRFTFYNAFIILYQNKIEYLIIHEKNFPLKIIIYLCCTRTCYSALKFCAFMTLAGVLLVQVTWVILFSNTRGRQISSCSKMIKIISFHQRISHTGVEYGMVRFQSLDRLKK